MEVKKETSAVLGSPSQLKAPMARQREMMSRTTLHLIAAGLEEEMISVSRLSKALRSSQATCSRDIFFSSNLAGRLGR